MHHQEPAWDADTFAQAEEDFQKWLARKDSAAGEEEQEEFWCTRNVGIVVLGEEEKTQSSPEWDADALEQAEQDFQQWLYCRHRIDEEEEDGGSLAVLQASEGG